MSRVSITGTRKELISNIQLTGLVSMTSGVDQYQKATPSIKNTSENITVIIVDRTNSFFSIASLTVPNTDLDFGDISVSHLKIPTR
jgi:hypothetical protein